GKSFRTIHLSRT
ncbi:unnamed protein product, partial [Mesorhabditis belari]